VIISPETKAVLGIIAPVISAMGDGIYIWSIVRGTTRPHLFSWLLWALMLAIIFCGQIISGAGPGAWLTGYNILANLVIVILALRSGYERATRSDWIALGVALAGIPIWVMTKDPFWSVCLETVVSFFLYYPTFRKTYHDPYSEHPVPYAIFGAAIFFQIAAMDHYNATVLLYPVSAIVIVSSFVAMVYWRRRILRN
jgi:hypothetical protein